MRLILLVFLLLYPAFLFSQDVTIIRDADSGYFVTVRADSVITEQGVFFSGDTLAIGGQTRYTAEYTAIRAGLSYMARNDLPRESIQVVGGNRFRLGVDLWYFEDEIIEEVVDTMYIESPVDGFRDLNIQLTGWPDKDEWEILSTAVTNPATVDSVLVHYQCDGNNSQRFHFSDAVFVGRFRSTCPRDTDITYRFYASDQVYTTQRHLPGYLFSRDINQAPFWSSSDLWQQHWQQTSMLYTHQGDLVHEQLESGSQTWIFQNLGEKKSFHILARISPGIHLRLFSDPDGRSQDIYFFGENLRYARWLPGNPGSTQNYDELVIIPVDSSYDFPLLEVEIDSARVRARLWDEGDPPDWQLDTPPQDWQPGRLGIGAHSVGTRRIHIYHLQTD
jgi:hypothetical protein